MRTRNGLGKSRIGSGWTTKVTSWIGKQTNKAEDISMTFENKKWTWEGHIMPRIDNGWTAKVTVVTEEL